MSHADVLRKFEKTAIESYEILCPSTFVYALKVNVRYISFLPILSSLILDFMTVSRALFYQHSHGSILIFCSW